MFHQSPAQAAALAQMERDNAARARVAGRSRPRAEAGAARRVLLVSLEGSFDVTDDPSLAAYRTALQERGHVVIQPLSWTAFQLAPAVALASCDMVLVLAASAGGSALLVTPVDAAGAALRTWVAEGGTFAVVQAEDRCNSFARLFDKPWAYTDYYRTTHTLNEAAEHAAVFASPAVPQSFSVKAVLFSDVPSHEVVASPAQGAEHESMSMQMLGGGSQPSPHKAAIACGSFGAGRVASLGDVNWESPTLCALAALADAARPRSAVEAAAAGGGTSDTRLPPCCVCGAMSASSCSRCGASRYCAKPCQAHHWATHKRECTPRTST